MEEPCSRCGEAERLPIGSYCRECKATYMRERYAKKGAKWSCCCRCRGPLESPKQPYCAACRKEYQRERAAKRKALQPPKPPHVPKPPPTRPAIICPECGLLFKRRHRWLPCDDCRERKKEAEREQKAEKARQKQKPKQKKEPKPKQALMTCASCGAEEAGPHNKVRCGPCTDAYQLRRLAERDVLRREKRRAEKRCPCGAPAAVTEGRLGNYCLPCRKQSERDENCRKQGVRRARKLNNGRGPVSIRRLWAEFKGRCPECRVKVTRSNGHVDHIIPLAKGGAHSQENLQILCSSCNLKKSDTIPCVQLRFPES